MEQPGARANPFGISLGPRVARRIGWAVCVLAGCGLLVTATIVVLTFVRTRPLHGVIWLLLPGILVAVAGVLWATWILTERGQPAAKRSRFSFLSDPKMAFRQVFGGLPTRARIAGVASAVLLLLAAFTSAPPVTGLGHPLPPTLHCKYRVNEQGVPTCVSKATYYQAGRDDQRFVASWFALVYVGSLALAASELVGRRRED